MVWGCFSYNGQSLLHVIDRIMNAVKYKEILENNFVDSVVKMGLRRGYIFQQDNDPKHKLDLCVQLLFISLVFSL